MEADWSVALGSGDPVITVPWMASRECKFVDLRFASHPIHEIVEARRTPALRSALLMLNGPASRYWTAKCGTWSSSLEEGAAAIDPYEMNADQRDVAFGAGSYVDVLQSDLALFACFERQEGWLRAVTTKLRSIPAEAVRVDLILREAIIEAAPGFAVSWFVEGCGATTRTAKQHWQAALGLSLEVIMNTGAEGG